MYVTKSKFQEHNGKEIRRRTLVHKKNKPRKSLRKRKTKTLQSIMLIKQHKLQKRAPYPPW